MRALTKSEPELEGLPQDWNIVELGDLLDRMANGLTCKQEKEPPGIPVSRIETISAGVIDFDRVRYVRDIDDTKKEKFLLQQGDLLFSHINSDMHLGKTAVVTSSKPLLHGMNLLVLRTKKGLLDPYYLHYLMNHFRFSGEFISIAQHAVNQSSLNQKKIGSLKIPLAPIEQQRAIVAEIEKQFSRLDEAVANLKRVKANLKRYKAAVLKAAVEGKLTEEWRKAHPDVEPASKLLDRILAERRAKWEEAELARMEAKGKAPKNDKWKEKYKEPAEPDITNLPKLPEGWVWATVESLSRKVTDGVHKKPSYVTEGIPFVTVKNLTAGDGISFEDLNYVTPEDHAEFCKRTHPERGDILISKDGTLGVVRLIETDRVFSIFVSVALVKPVSYDLSRYLVTAFESSVVQRQMVPKGSGLQHIHLEDLRADCIPVPPLAEQYRIVAEVDCYLSLIRETETQVNINLQRTERLRQSILSRAFTGHLCPAEETEESLSDVPNLLDMVAESRAGYRGEK